MNLLSLTAEAILLEKAVKRVELFLPNILSDISFTFEKTPYAKLIELNIDENDFSAAYENGVIYIGSQATIDCLVHELGHCIHEQLFSFKEFNFSEKGKSEYAYKNHREDFAEAFTDLIRNQSVQTIRDKEIYNILTS